MKSRNAAAIGGCIVLILLIFHVYYGNKTVSEYFYSRQLFEPRTYSSPPPVRAATDILLTIPVKGTGLQAVSASREDDQHDASSGSKGLVESEEDQIQVEVFPAWPQSDPHDQVFTRRAYLYSAFIALHHLPTNGTDVHIVSFQEGHQVLPLKCCLKLRNGQGPFEGQGVQVDYTRTWLSSQPTEGKVRGQIGLVYNCHFTYTTKQLRTAYVTLTPTSCPVEGLYLPIQQPERRPGGLAICGKVTFGHSLDPWRLVEWFEVQRLLGVDRVVLFDLQHSEVVDRILRHYHDSGLLDRLPYKLPGSPWGRDISRNRRRTTYGDEQLLTAWDCRLRLAGYDFVMALDLDEVIMPRNTSDLKAFLTRHLGRHHNRAAVYFLVQFFLDDFGPVDPTASLKMLRYLNSTKPLWSRQKYVYVPSRIHQVHTHRVKTYKGYSTAVVPTQEATLFHYRNCNNTGTCGSQPITDTRMTKFQDVLIPRVLSVWKSVGLK